MDNFWEAMKYLPSNAHVHTATHTYVMQYPFTNPVAQLYLTSSLFVLIIHCRCLLLAKKQYAAHSVVCNRRCLQYTSIFLGYPIYIYINNFLLRNLSLVFYWSSHHPFILINFFTSISKGILLSI